MLFDLRSKAKKFLASYLLVSLLSFSFPFSPVFAVETPDVPASHSQDEVSISSSNNSGLLKLRLLETTDLHANIVDYDYFKDVSSETLGLARTADLIRQARAQEQNNLLFDCGDLIQGTPMGSYVAKVNPLKAGEKHPVHKAMELLQYDMATLGNHEFNFGLDFLDQTLAATSIPYISANVYNDDHDNDPTNDKNRYTPYKILDKTFTDDNGQPVSLKVGVIGFVPPQIMDWDKPNLEGQVITKDIKETAEKFVPQMKMEGADIIVALAHTGKGDETYTTGEEDEVYQLTQVSGINAIFYGHSHKSVAESVNGVPTVQAGYWGSNLGIIDLTLQKIDGIWQVNTSNTETRAIYDKTNKVSLVTAQQDVINAVNTEHLATLDYVRQPVGETAARIYSYFALVQDDPSIQIVTNAQKWYVEKTLKGTQYEGIPVLSAGAPFKAGGSSPDYYTDVPKGTLAIKNVADLYLYDNTVYAVKLNGAQLKEWLEMSAGQFNQIDPAKTGEQPLINTSFKTYNFDVIDGVTYEIDVTQPAKYDANKNIINASANRIKNLSYNGQPVADSQEFVVATNNYRANNPFPGCKDGEQVLKTTYENREAIVDYIKELGTINPSADNNWSFAPVSGDVNLTFTSSPKAQELVTDYPKISYVGEAENGFTKYSLSMKGDSKNTVSVQLLGMNDFHGQLDTYKEYKDSNGNVTSVVGGAEYVAAHLKQREAQNPNTLIVHSGDMVGASAPVSALLQDEPTVDFMNRVGFDVGTFGNHEFDKGIEEAKRLVNGGTNPETGKMFEGANFDYVSANVVYEDNQNVFSPYTVKELNGVKIGFIGVTTVETPNIVTPSGIAGINFIDPVAATNNAVSQLKNLGVKTIVVLAHCGAAGTGDQSSGEAVDIAKGVDPEVDVIFAGHNHVSFNQNISGKLVVESSYYGRSFADVDLEIDPATGDVVSKKAEIVDTVHEGITPDAEIYQMVQEYLESVGPILNEPIGQTEAVISKTQNESGESALGNLIADAQRSVMKTDFAFMNPGGIRADMPQGNVSWGDLFKIQPFGNTLMNMTLSGAQIRELLNQQWLGTKTRICSISGFTYTWDDSKPKGQKVVDIKKADGTPLQDDMNYTITVNSFLADGGDEFTVLKSGTNRIGGPVDLDGLIQYINEIFVNNNKPITVSIEGRIQMAATVTSVTLTSSSSIQAVGGYATISATANGVDNPVYQFWVKNSRDDSWISSGEYSSNTYAFTQYVPGTYTVVANAKSAGAADDTAIQSAALNVAFTKIGSVSALNITGPEGSQAIGSSANFIATATDDGGAPYYEFWLHDASGWKITQNWSSTNHYALNDLQPGSFVIAVNSLDQADKDAGSWDMAYYKSFVLNVGSNVSLTVPDSGAVNSPVNITANAVNITSPVYQFWYQKPDGSWVGGNYNSAATYSFTPTDVGDYKFIVYAKDPFAPADWTHSVWSDVKTIKCD